MEEVGWENPMAKKHQRVKVSCLLAVLTV